MGSVRKCYISNNRLSTKHRLQALAEVTGRYMAQLTSVQHIIRKKLKNRLLNMHELPLSYQRLPIK